MAPEDYALAARVYCAEAIQSGVTTFVENDATVRWDDFTTTEAKLAVYDESGIRNVYGAGFADDLPGEGFLALLADIRARNPGTDHPPADRYTCETETALSGIEDLIERYHGTAEGRQTVWPAPVSVAGTTTDGLQGAYRLAGTERTRSVREGRRYDRLQEEFPVSPDLFIHTQYTPLWNERMSRSGKTSRSG